MALTAQLLVLAELLVPRDGPLRPVLVGDHLEPDHPVQLVLELREIHEAHDVLLDLLQGLHTPREVLDGALDRLDLILDLDELLAHQDRPLVQVRNVLRPLTPEIGPLALHGLQLGQEPGALGTLRLEILLEHTHSRAHIHRILQLGFI